MNATIRHSKPDDLPALVEMGQAFHEEAGHAESMPFDILSFGHTIAVFGTAGTLLVVEKDGEIVGMGAADVAPSICNHGVKIGREAFWYIAPNHRKGIGQKLLSALECVAKEHGASFFDGVAENGARSLALARIYEGRSYNLIERTFRKRL